MGVFTAPAIISVAEECVEYGGIDEPIHFVDDGDTGMGYRVRRVYGRGAPGTRASRSGSVGLVARYISSRSPMDGKDELTKLVDR